MDGMNDRILLFILALCLANTCLMTAILLLLIKALQNKQMEKVERMIMQMIIIFLLAGAAIAEDEPAFWDAPLQAGPLPLIDLPDATAALGGLAEELALRAKFEAFLGNDSLNFTANTTEATA